MVFLAYIIPRLQHFSTESLVGNDDHARSLIIARISSLVTLDGTRVRLLYFMFIPVLDIYHDVGSASQISSRERTDSELYYMSFIIQQGHQSEDQRRGEHRRWAELCDSSVSCWLMQINSHLPFLSTREAN
jgi:hypothetical protein